MTVELQPEIEALLRRRMEREGVSSVEEVLMNILNATANEETKIFHKVNFAEFLLESPLHNSGLVLDRVSDEARPVDL